MNYKFYNCLTDECKMIRQKVFIEEQNFKNEFDDIDNKAIHIVACVDDKPVGTGRMFQSKNSGEYIIGRIAVLKDYRKYHIGGGIVKAFEEKAKELGAVKISLSAQCRVREFYEKLGFTAIGKTYYDEYCEHIKMIKKLR
ncbi:MAG: GNAT family N-acetyltransferase [Clostridia bacterium]|nr:GNAT family N-acetyltransferase [Clostridia bacterium]